YRLDHPEMDPPQWEKLLPMRQSGGEVAVRELSLDFHLKPPYAPTYAENYQLHASRATTNKGGKHP
ncbi:MAG: hypothetical protein H6Q55_3527, partial [Deltaproteobacteria bacterium]|nr:hypothetical protein [Deltaproteobacteria bacterium]